MSAPDTKALPPAPVSTTTRTSGSSRNSVSARPNPSHISSDMALRLSGLLKVITPTPPAEDLRILPSANDVSLGSPAIAHPPVVAGRNVRLKRGPGQPRRGEGLAAAFAWR